MTTDAALEIETSSPSLYDVGWVLDYRNTEGFAQSATASTYDYVPDNLNSDGPESLTFEPIKIPPNSSKFGNIVFGLDDPDFTRGFDLSLVVCDGGIIGLETFEKTGSFDTNCYRDNVKITLVPYDDT